MTCANAGRINHSRKINLYIIYGSKKAQGCKEGNEEGSEEAPIVSRKIPASDAGIFHFVFTMSAGNFFQRMFLWRWIYLKYLLRSLNMFRRVSFMCREMSQIVSVTVVLFLRRKKAHFEVG